MQSYALTVLTFGWRVIFAEDLVLRVVGIYDQQVRQVMESAGKASIMIMDRRALKGNYM